MAVYCFEATPFITESVTKIQKKTRRKKQKGPRINDTEKQYTTTAGKFRKL